MADSTPPTSVDTPHLREYSGYFEDLAARAKALIEPLRGVSIASGAFVEANSLRTAVDNSVKAYAMKARHLADGLHDIHLALLDQAQLYDGTEDKNHHLSDDYNRQVATATAEMGQVSQGSATGGQSQPQSQPQSPAAPYADPVGLASVHDAAQAVYQQHVEQATDDQESESWTRFYPI